MIESTFTSLRIDVPVLRACRYACIMAGPRMFVDVNHLGAGTRA